MNRLLEVKGLRVEFKTESGAVLPVDDISFDVMHGETLCIVGESGCGKSVTSLALMRLLARSAKISGSVLFNGADLIKLSEKGMREIRGKEISMIFQEPMTSLNPVFTCGNQLVEVLRQHSRMSSAEAKHRSVEMLRKVGIPEPERRFDAYSHQLSGGMRQRVMICMALLCSPKLLIADEPTTALDVTIQAQILLLMKKLKNEMNTSILLITHDLGVVAETAQRVVVMYAGRIVELGSAEQIFRNPIHPYTKGLLASIPRLHDASGTSAVRKTLPTIEGTVPDLLHMPKGCAFSPRCALRTDKCDEKPPLCGDEHKAACWHSRGCHSQCCNEERAVML